MGGTGCEEIGCSRWGRCIRRHWGAAGVWGALGCEGTGGAQGGCRYMGGHWGGGADVWRQWSVRELG